MKPIEVEVRRPGLPNPFDAESYMMKKYGRHSRTRAARVRGVLRDILKKAIRQSRPAPKNLDS